jgi:regulator of cell morphogenesis and NO signaling
VAAADDCVSVCPGLDIRALVDHLERTHHRYLWDTLPRLTELADEAVLREGDCHPHLASLARTLASLRNLFEAHLRKEERLLFPMVRDLAAVDARPSFHCGSLRNPIAVMRGEHDEVDRCITVARELTAGFTAPPGAGAAQRALLATLAELEADTRRHVHTENEVLFPEVERLERTILEVAASHLSG